MAAKRHPPNGYAAKFSIPYAITVGMLYDDAGMNEYEETVGQNPAVRAVAGKVADVVDFDNPYPRQFTGHLRVTLRNGVARIDRRYRHEHRQVVAYGAPGKEKAPR